MPPPSPPLRRLCTNSRYLHTVFIRLGTAAYKDFLIILCGLYSGVAYNQARLIFLIALPYRKEYMAFSLSLATFVSIELSFHILFSSASRAHPSQEGL